MSGAGAGVSASTGSTDGTSVEPAVPVDPGDDVDDAMGALGSVSEGIEGVVPEAVAEVLFFCEESGEAQPTRTRRATGRTGRNFMRRIGANARTHGTRGNDWSREWREREARNSQKTVKVIQRTAV